MSRLIIKNLPCYVTSIRLREHFEQKGGPGGNITDSKVAVKPDGTSRRFGFIGFKTKEEAFKAKQYYDRTFIDSARVSGVKDAPAPRPNKRPKLGPSPVDDVPVSQMGLNEEDQRDDNTNKQLHDFMDIMKPRTKKGPSWSNDDVIPAVSGESIPASGDARFPADLAQKGPLSDMEWMKQRMTQAVADQVEKVFEQSDPENDDKPLVDMTIPREAALPTTSDPSVDAIMNSSRLFVRNLAFSCTDAELLELLKPFGEISQIHIPLDSETKQTKGLAFITFVQPTNAVAAYKALDKTSFQGRLLHFLPAIDRKGKMEPDNGDLRKKSVKDERNMKKKAMAGKEFNWSMLYMNSDAVASSIADRMNIEKAEILNPEYGDNAAVKLALAETHIIQETKLYLESQGVLLSSFASKARSDTTILVKNIPYGTTAEHIKELFEPYGELGRVLVPPAGTMAVVDFDRADEARKAFRAVAYRRLGNSVIYLERGPLGIFDGTVSELFDVPSTSESLHVVKIAEQASNAAEDEPSVTGGTTLYVKNLAFSTTQERLADVFRHLPSFAFARVQTKPDAKRSDGSRLSMGFGFVGFKDVDGASTALRSMQGFVLDGHALHVKFAGRGTSEVISKDNSNRSQTPKMLVKNIPFEATKKDIRDLFGAHGQVKSVRVPKKFDAHARGFAFVEFVSRHEAENAYCALRHTHLLGRHLVLEWAEEAEQDVDVLRQKAGVGFGGGRTMPGKKRKLELGKNGDEDVEDL